MTPQRMKVWTDGACFPNPGMGGWGWTTLDGASGSGGANPTTNQQMELTAVLEAVSTLWRPGTHLTVISDSQYVIRGATEWIHKWVQNGWKNSKGEAVKNQDLWRELIEILAETQVQFQWVRGHTGDPGNEEADRLATLASKAPADLIAKCRKGWHGVGATQ